MTRSTASSESMSSAPETTTATDTGDGNPGNREDHNNDLIFETLRDKLEAGHGECIYRLNNSCKFH